MTPQEVTITTKHEARVAVSLLFMLAKNEKQRFEIIRLLKPFAPLCHLPKKRMPAFGVALREIAAIYRLKER